jgi:hypothetical protein
MLHEHCPNPFSGPPRGDAISSIKAIKQGVMKTRPSHPVKGNPDF